MSSSLTPCYPGMGEGEEPVIIRPAQSPPHPNTLRGTIFTCVEAFLSSKQLEDSVDCRGKGLPCFIDIGFHVGMCCKAYLWLLHHYKHTMHLWISVHGYSNNICMPCCLKCVYHVHLCQLLKFEAVLNRSSLSACCTYGSETWIPTVAYVKHS